jgi:hypothetical protein
MRISGHGLVQQPVEQQAPVVGGAAVEPEGELVEVVVEMLAADAMVQGSLDPACEQVEATRWTPGSSS